ncbi:hypothetical protein C8A00DRAFT_14193, partial [Chaetomidium leptoderma]
MSTGKRPSVLKRFTSRGAHSDSDVAAPPPTYDAATNGAAPSIGQTDADVVNLTAAFENLEIQNIPTDPGVDTCLAHLKLLAAIQWMKEDVGFTDGLWGLWDARAGPIDPLLQRRPEKPKEKEKAGLEPSIEQRLQNKNLETLSRIREKRWALFVARAVDRYEAWWKAMVRGHGGPPLSERDMDIGHSVRYADFPTGIHELLFASEEELPPLVQDVLMVWHSHMLNPRAFLEDAMLAGMRSFWASGLPWHLVNKAIDTDFNYSVSADCKARWTVLTRLPWDNTDGSSSKEILCPGCGNLLEIPWTTCGHPEDHRDKWPPNLTGNGYGDGNLEFFCRARNCATVVSKELLSVAKFVDDAKLLSGSENRPMPGTLLDPRTGTPSQPPPCVPPRNTWRKNMYPQTFPNRLLKSACCFIRSDIEQLPRIYGGGWNPTMGYIRQLIQKVLEENTNIREINEVPKTTKGRYTLPPASRIAVRKMMSRYWENFSPFALDLRGAVMRQGVFVDKMCKLDWLHSPSARETMARLVTKYGRFMEIMKANSDQMVVPTLDVDLAWHTHQLSPARYYWHTVNLTGRFIDHDDKIDENELSRQFEWTSKVYQDTFGEVYSECTCWYCEAIRSSHIGSVSRVLGFSKQERIAESFHTSGAASLHPPNASAHISSHNAVHATPDPTLPPTSTTLTLRTRITARLDAIHKRRLDAAYAKARARAEKRGRVPPRRDDVVYYDHWGYPYLYTAPYAYALWWTPGMYYGWCPGAVYACGGGSGG